MFKVEIRYTDYHKGFTANHRYSYSDTSLNECLDFVHTICDAIPITASVDCVHIFSTEDDEEVYF